MPGESSDDIPPRFSAIEFNRLGTVSNGRIVVSFVRPNAPSAFVCRRIVRVMFDRLRVIRDCSIIVALACPNLCTAHVSEGVTRLEVQCFTAIFEGVLEITFSAPSRPPDRVGRRIFWVDSNDFIEVTDRIVEFLLG